MPKKGIEKQASDYDCSVEAALDVIGGKWKGVILFHLFEGTQRFGELQRRIPNVTRRMLTLSLRELESAGLVHREVYKQVPPKVEYSLTDYGQTLRPIIFSLRTWGDGYLERLQEGQLEQEL
ncbi:MAG: helix-turn-helix domain-containing protein [Chloroflexota bacterium]